MARALHHYCFGFRAFFFLSLFLTWWWSHMDVALDTLGSLGIPLELEQWAFWQPLPSTSVFASLA
jgi:hypothetical protein